LILAKNECWGLTLWHEFCILIVKSTIMTQEEIKNYLKDNLRMEWEYHTDGNYYMVLKVAGEKICQLNFGEGY